MHNQFGTDSKPYSALTLGWNFQRQAEMQYELEHEFSTMLESAGVHAKDSKIVAEELLKAITEIAPPERVSNFIGFTVASSYSYVSEGKHKKAGSVLLSLDHLFRTLASGLPLSSSLTGPIEPWAIVAATITFWSSIRGIASVYEADSNIGAFWTLWNLSDSAGVINSPLQDILVATNNRLVECGKNKIGLAELKMALDYLKYIRIVSASKYGGLYIVKWVRVKYM